MQESTPENESLAPAEKWMPLLYDDLRELAGKFFVRQPRGHTLQPTALVNEAYLRLARREDIECKSRTHFFNVAAKAMRQILIDHVRGRRASKRGGSRLRVNLDDIDPPTPEQNVDLRDLLEGLDRLAKLNARHSAVFVARAFGGLTIKEVAEELGVSTTTVENDWLMARSWLYSQLAKPDGPDS